MQPPKLHLELVVRKLGKGHIKEFFRRLKARGLTFEGRTVYGSLGLFDGVIIAKVNQAGTSATDLWTTLAESSFYPRVRGILIREMQADQEPTETEKFMPRDFDKDPDIDFWVVLIQDETSEERERFNAEIACVKHEAAERRGKPLVVYFEDMSDEEERRIENNPDAQPITMEESMEKSKQFYTRGLPDVDTTQLITSDEPVDLEAEIEKSKGQSALPKRILGGMKGTMWFSPNLFGGDPNSTADQ